jgi:large subunit ribosomal protein L19
VERLNLVDKVEKEQLKEKVPSFNVGDIVKVHCKIREGDRERTQIFQGTVIRKKRGANRATFTVRKISYGVGVERIFPLHSPNVGKIEVVREGKVRRAKLYYLRGLRGKAARVKAKDRV